MKKMPNTNKKLIDTTITDFELNFTKNVSETLRYFENLYNLTNDTNFDILETSNQKIINNFKKILGENITISGKINKPQKKQKKTNITFKRLKYDLLYFFDLDEKLYDKNLSSILNNFVYEKILEIKKEYENNTALDTLYLKKYSKLINVLTTNFRKKNKHINKVNNVGFSITGNNNNNIFNNNIFKDYQKFVEVFIQNKVFDEITLNLFLEEDLPIIKSLPFSSNDNEKIDNIILKGLLLKIKKFTNLKISEKEAETLDELSYKLSGVLHNKNIIDVKTNQVKIKNFPEIPITNDVDKITTHILTEIKNYDLESITEFKELSNDTKQIIENVVDTIINNFFGNDLEKTLKDKEIIPVFQEFKGQLITYFQTDFSRDKDDLIKINEKGQRVLDTKKIFEKISKRSIKIRKNGEEYKKESVISIQKDKNKEPIYIYETGSRNDFDVLYLSKSEENKLNAISMSITTNPNKSRNHILSYILRTYYFQKEVLDKIPGNQINEFMNSETFDKKHHKYIDLLRGSNTDDNILKDILKNDKTIPKEILNIQNEQKQKKEMFLYISKSETLRNKLFIYLSNKKLSKLSKYSSYEFKNILNTTNYLRMLFKTQGEMESSTVFSKMKFDVDNIISLTKNLNIFYEDSFYDKKEKLLIVNHVNTKKLFNMYSDLILNGKINNDFKRIVDNFRKYEKDYLERINFLIKKEQPDTNENMYKLLENQKNILGVPLYPSISKTDLDQKDFEKEFYNLMNNYNNLNDKEFGLFINHIFIKIKENKKITSKNLEYIEQFENNLHIELLSDKEKKNIQKENIELSNKDKEIEKLKSILTPEQMSQLYPN